MKTEHVSFDNYYYYIHQSCFCFHQQLVCHSLFFEVDERNVKKAIVNYKLLLNYTSVSSKAYVQFIM